MNQSTFCLCIDPNCNNQRVINFVVDQERFPHLDHVVQHLNDVYEQFQKDPNFSEFKISNHQLIDSMISQLIAKITQALKQYGENLKIKDNTESLYKTFNLIKEEDAAKLAAKNQELTIIMKMQASQDYKEQVICTRQYYRSNFTSQIKQLEEQLSQILPLSEKYRKHSEDNDEGDTVTPKSFREDITPIENIFRELEESNINDFNYSYNDSETFNIDKLGIALQSQQKITNLRLDLSNAQITQITELVKAIDQMDYLKSFYLNLNYTLVSDIKPLAQALSRKSSIEQFYLILSESCVPDYLRCFYTYLPDFIEASQDQYY